MEILEQGYIYHIFNRANNHDKMFFDPWNYYHFIDLTGKYIEPIAEVYAYCLLPNHFHLLLRFKDAAELEETIDRERALWKYFSDMFNAYTKKMNLSYDRRSSLFEKTFKRKRVMTINYFLNVLKYIHFNPARHGILKEFSGYEYSSFREYISNWDDKTNGNIIYDFFDDLANFAAFHTTAVDENVEREIIEAGME